jgi:hypothetical protein
MLFVYAGEAGIVAAVAKVIGGVQIENIIPIQTFAMSAIYLFRSV